MKNERCEKCECWHSDDNPVILTDEGVLECLECIGDEEIDWDLWEKSARSGGQG